MTTSSTRADGQNERPSLHMSSEDSDSISGLYYAVPGQQLNAAAGPYMAKKQLLNHKPMVNAIPNSYDYQADGSFYNNGSRLQGYNSYGQAGVVPDNNYDGGEYDQDELFYNSRPPQ